MGPPDFYYGNICTYETTYLYLDRYPYNQIPCVLIRKYILHRQPTSNQVDLMFESNKTILAYEYAGKIWSLNTNANLIKVVSSVSFWGGWGCEVSCGGHHRPIGKTTTGSALDGAVFDIAQILAYLVHNMSRSQIYFGFGHFGWLPSFSGNNILAGLWLNCISSVEITLFLLADILLQHWALFQC